MKKVDSRIESWFKSRTFKHQEFSSGEKLTNLKLSQKKTISLILPTKNVASTIGSILRVIASVNYEFDLFDEIIVIDANSSDGTVEIASGFGVKVVSENSVMPQFGHTLGKGDAMWRSLSLTRGDIISFVDTDTEDFGPHYLLGIIGPLLTVSSIEFVKAAYRRPYRDGDMLRMDEGGRVTELTARPVLSTFFPDLIGFVQPLAGEFSASRSLLFSIPFLTRYGVEIGMLVDVWKTVGLKSMAQVDLGSRQNRHQSLESLSCMANDVLYAALSRLNMSPSIDEQKNYYCHARASGSGFQIKTHAVNVVERPPMQSILGI